MAEPRFTGKGRVLYEGRHVANVDYRLSVSIGRSGLKKLDVMRFDITDEHEGGLEGPGMPLVPEIELELEGGTHKVRILLTPSIRARRFAGSLRASKTYRYTVMSGPEPIS